MSSDAIAHLRHADPVLAGLIDQVGSYLLERREASFAALVRAIVGQQISTAAAATIDRRLRDLTGDPPTPDALLSLDDEALRGAGLSRSKQVAVRELALRALEGDLDIGSLADLDDEAVVATLTRSRGIGRWTAEMYLIFALGRPDVLPIGDLGFRNAVRRAYGDTVEHSPSGLMALGERWRPYRSVATWYLWRSLALPPRD
ncbi:MAG: DNA-3-methyladenine glycosylase [Dehalococcoidia bacterium]